VSRWLLTDTYSPSAMDAAPATRPAMPAARTTLGVAEAPATPTTRPAIDTMPSSAPSTPARSQFNFDAIPARREAPSGPEAGPRPMPLAASDPRSPDPGQVGLGQAVGQFAAQTSRSRRGAAPLRAPTTATILLACRLRSAPPGLAAPAGTADVGSQR